MAVVGAESFLKVRDHCESKGRKKMGVKREQEKASSNSPPKYQRLLRQEHFIHSQNRGDIER
jgi:hypothetical protein